MRRALVPLALTVGCLLAACSSGAGSSAGGSSPDTLSGRVTVFAASSLTEAFTTLGKRFEKLHPGTSVTFDFDASSTLAEQITQGAPADVFASASATNMTQVTGAGYATKPTTFVSNTMEIAVPPDNPAHVRALADLARSGVKVAVCDPTVPCGAVAQQVFDKAQLRVKPVTVQPDVKSTLTQVELGEVDAGMVYVTDVRAAGSQVRGIAIPPRENASTAYPIAALPKGPNPQGGRAFVRFVLSSAGQRVLLADGFHRP